jgi:hypothetical protein
MQQPIRLSLRQQSFLPISGLFICALFSGVNLVTGTAKAMVITGADGLSLQQCLSLYKKAQWARTNEENNYVTNFEWGNERGRFLVENNDVLEIATAESGNGQLDCQVQNRFSIDGAETEVVFDPGLWTGASNAIQTSKKFHYSFKGEDSSFVLVLSSVQHCAVDKKGNPVDCKASPDEKLVIGKAIASAP